ncbi:MAG TPA: sterol desaturase family protein [Alphaproteobacteria bacterium]|nr:sterol desaturase family protein [Alphaproteobacteria bacterium]
MKIPDKFWDGHKYHLDKMSLRELVHAYFAYPAIQVYLLIGSISGTAALWWTHSTIRTILAAVAAVLVYPLIWYLLHRFVLHGSFLYKMEWSAALWKRIHFDHHRDPHDLRVLFGSLVNTLPTIAIVTVPLGWAIGGVPCAAAALSAGLFTTCVYEFCHCIQHLAYQPKNAYLKKIKRLHLAHHFHNETGNFGITNFYWDRILGTFYGDPRQVPKSATVFNLGYAQEAAHRWPFVARLTKDWEQSPHGRRRGGIGS